MSDNLLKTEVVSKDWVSLEIMRSTKDLVSKDELDKRLEKEQNTVDIKLKLYISWKWALYIIVSLCGIFFGGVWGLFEFFMTKS